MHIDQAFLNGKVITMDADNCIQEAVAVKAGKIAAVGSNAQIMALCGPDTKVIDLQGKTMTPGFVDGHSHLMPAVRNAMTEGVRCLVGIGTEAIRRHKQNRAGRWPVWR